MDLGDVIKHYGVKGMKWDESKVDQYEQQMEAFIKKHKLSPKQVAEIKARVRKLKLQAAKGAKKKVNKIVKGSNQTIKPKHKNKKYTVDFKSQNEKKVNAASDALSKKRTAEGHKQQKQIAEDKYWKNRTKDGRKEMKDHAVNDHFDKIRKAKDEKAASKDKAVNEHYKKVRKAESDKAASKSAKEKATNAYYKKMREQKETKPKKKQSMIDKVVDNLTKNSKPKVTFLTDKTERIGDFKRNHKVEKMFKEYAKTGKKPKKETSLVDKVLTKAFGKSKPTISINGVEQIRTKSGKLVPKDKKLREQEAYRLKAATDPSGALQDRIGKMSAKEKKKIRDKWKKVPNAKKSDA